MMDVGSISHKTVFVLDHSYRFLELSGETIDVDIGNRRRSVSPSMPVSKTMWTLCVEAVVEYCRVTFDLFGLSKVFSLITSDSEGKVLTAWFDEDQTVEQLLSSLSEEGPPRPQEPAGGATDVSVVHGVVQGGKVLSIPSPKQQQAHQKGEAVGNRGRVIVITTGLDKDGAKTIVDRATSEFAELEIANGCMRINEAELLLVNMRPPGCADRLEQRELSWVNEQTRAAVVDCAADMSFVRTMMHMCQEHFDLASTTVCDIPMKEEAPAGTGAQSGNNKNYKVELLHASAAHDVLHKSNAFESARREMPRSGFSSSLLLKWLTPKNPASGKPELHHCTGTYLVTTADVCHRASTCLVSFLLAGRSVMLEQRCSEDGQAGGRTTHMLSSHGGDLYMHTLAYHRSALEEPTTITECIGGKCTDYRIQDFTALMQTARLAPASERVSFIPIDRAFSHLERQTRYWPMAISESYIYHENLSRVLSPLLSLLPKEYLEEGDVEACKACIIELVSQESRGTALPQLTMALRNKGVNKRQEQFRILFTELEYFLCRYTDLSPTHKKLLSWYLQTAGRRINAGDPRPDADRPTGLRLLDERLRDAKAGAKEPAKVEAMAADEPPEKKWKFENGHQLKKSGSSLLEMVRLQHKAKTPSRPDFAGRLEAKAAGRSQAELYQHLLQKEKKALADSAP